MRAALAFLLGLLALVLTAVATPALWLERNVVDETGYVSLVDPLGRDAAFQDALATTLTDAVLARADLSSTVDETARPVLLQVAQNLTRLPGYADAWTETNRRSHALVFDGSQSGEVAIDVAPLAQLLADESTGRLGVDLPVPSTLPVTVGGEQERRAVDASTTLDPRAYYLAGAALLLAVLCVAAARRRSTAVLWLGIGTLVVAGLLKATAAVVLPELARASGSSDLGDQVIELLRQAAGSSFDGWLLALGGLGVVLLVLGGIARVVSRRHDAPA
ncbi:hypothetical protein [Solicola sp. PLA-1-18]|uniref:hypothetical protein n=1 Tax=Solicola sp. PLA-1-18 TaxID=3380532 RepID=UPI003B7930E0